MADVRTTLERDIGSLVEDGTFILEWLFPYLKCGALKWTTQLRCTSTAFYEREEMTYSLPLLTLCSARTRKRRRIRDIKNVDACPSCRHVVTAHPRNFSVAYCCTGIVRTGTGTVRSSLLNADIAKLAQLENKLKGPVGA